MATLDPIVRRELPLIRKIIQDETWLEGERRQTYVRPDDPSVRDNVVAVILRIGAEMRRTCETALTGGGDLRATG